jgi:hypothetical protein
LLNCVRGGRRYPLLAQGDFCAIAINDTRHAAVIDALQALPLHDTLDRHSRQFKALFDLLRGTALWKIWLRALLLTGTAWGVALAALYAYVRGWPF